MFNLPFLRTYFVIALLACLSPILVWADGPADNNVATVRRIPKLGIEVPAGRATELRAKLAELQGAIASLGQSGLASEADIADVMIYERAVRCALDYQEFFAESEVKRADQLLNRACEQVETLRNRAGMPRVLSKLEVCGYVSRIDNTVQPYGLVLPADFDPNAATPLRCDLWFHGRGETLSELNFIWDRLHQVGEYSPAGTIVVHPYGRYSNAFKFAGETDVLEVLEDVKRRFKIDEDRVSVRGFSMGGAACWQFATHYSDRWFAANPGAGFSETPRFLDVFQSESLRPTPWQKTLWNLYDCDKYALNLKHCPTVAYSGEVDRQKQAADVMAEAMAEHGMTLNHIIGVGMGHKIDDASKQKIEALMEGYASQGRERVPRKIEFETYTLKYNRMHWITVDRLDEHWKRAHVTATWDAGPEKEHATVMIETENVAALAVEFPPATFSRENHATQVHVTIGTSRIDAVPESDGSLDVHLMRQSDGGWIASAPDSSKLAKRHNLQGPIDDALMDSFVFVRPTGKAANEAVGRWSTAELERAIEHWRRHFRGDARVVDDTDVSQEMIESANLVLWGDPHSNSIIGKVIGKLPVVWTEESLAVGQQTYDAKHHAAVMVYPNPLNPNRYVVLNSSFTFREYAYLNNARQVPMLPDWAIVNLDSPPTAVDPGEVVAAGFFDEAWQVKKP